MPDADLHLLTLGVQYYAVARAAVLARLVPVCGNLFHHALEMLLKARLSQTLTLEGLRQHYGHDLCKLWVQFKTEFPTASLEEFDNTVTTLGTFERLRYPDATIQEGAIITINWDRPSPDANAPAAPPRYDLVVSEIDRLVMKIFDLSSRNPTFFAAQLSDYGRDAVTRNNPIAGRWSSQPPSKFAVTARELYASLVQMSNHAESISWNRFYNFLMFNTILILAWATIYAADPHPQWFRPVLVVICLLGGGSGIFWAGLGYRGREFLQKYLDMGKRIEADTAIWAQDIENYKAYTETVELGKSLCCSWSQSRYLLIGGSLLLTLFYLVILIVSCVA